MAIFVPHFSFLQVELCNQNYIRKPWINLCNIDYFEYDGKQDNTFIRFNDNHGIHIKGSLIDQINKPDLRTA